MLIKNFEIYKVYILNDFEMEMYLFCNIWVSVGYFVFLDSFCKLKSLVILRVSLEFLV